MKIHDHAVAYVSERPGELVEREKITAYLHRAGIATLSDAQMGAITTKLVRDDLLTGEDTPDAYGHEFVSVGR